MCIRLVVYSLLLAAIGLAGCQSIPKSASEPLQKAGGFAERIEADADGTLYQLNSLREGK